MINSNSFDKNIFIDLSVLISCNQENIMMNDIVIIKKYRAEIAGGLGSLLAYT